MKTVYTDGATVGWNGKLGMVKEIGIGYWIREKNIRYAAKFIGSSNNEAEYIALILAMRHCIRDGYLEVEFRSDSEIVVHGAMYGKPTKNERMMRLKREVMFLKTFFKRVAFTWIPREDNMIADYLSKEGCAKKVANTFVYEDGTKHSNDVSVKEKPIISRKPVCATQKNIFELPPRKTMREILLGI